MQSRGFHCVCEWVCAFCITQLKCVSVYLCVITTLGSLSWQGRRLCVCMCVCMHTNTHTPPARVTLSNCASNLGNLCFLPPLPVSARFISPHAAATQVLLPCQQPTERTPFPQIRDEAAGKSPKGRGKDGLVKNI